MGEFASKGVAGTGLGLGIAGTALGLLNGGGNCGGGLLGGILGGGNNRNCEPMETREASCLRQQVAALQAEKYADGVGASVYRDMVTNSNRQDDIIRANQREGFNAIAALDKQVAVNHANFECLAAKLGETVGRVNVMEDKVCHNSASIQQLGANLKALASDTHQAIALEAERRASADEAIRCWVKGTYVPGQLSLSPDSMCPRPVTCCDVVDYFNAGGKTPVPSPCGHRCNCGSTPATV